MRGRGYLKWTKVRGLARFGCCFSFDLWYKTTFKGQVQPKILAWSGFKVERRRYRSDDLFKIESNEKWHTTFNRPVPCQDHVLAKNLESNKTKQTDSWFSITLGSAGKKIDLVQTLDKAWLDLKYHSMKAVPLTSLYHLRVFHTYPFSYE